MHPIKPPAWWLGEISAAPTLVLVETYQHTVAFALNYKAEPLVKLYADATIFNVSMTVTNLKRSDMELFYLAHVNFRPVDGGRLVLLCQMHT